MQYEHVLKKLNFDLLTLMMCVCGGGGGGGCGQNICSRIAAFVITLNLICNMTVLNS